MEVQVAGVTVEDNTKPKTTAAKKAAPKVKWKKVKTTAKKAAPKAKGKKVKEPTGKALQKFMDKKSQDAAAFVANRHSAKAPVMPKAEDKAATVVSPATLSSTKTKPSKPRSGKGKSLLAAPKATKATAKKATVAKPETTEDKRLSPLRTKKIKVLVTENPRREGFRGHKIFGLYRNGMQVEEFFKLGGHLGDINWDVKRKHIALID